MHTFLQFDNDKPFIKKMSIVHKNLVGRTMPFESKNSLYSAYVNHDAIT